MANASATMEKKVEYIELIFDLIFVHLMRRNNALLQPVEGGFLQAGNYFSYLFSALIILEIWYYATLFLNRYGEGRTQYSVVFVNMYLLYYMSGGLSGHYYRFCAAWILILLHLAARYWTLPLFHRHMTGRERAHAWRDLRMLLAETLIILISLPLYALFRVPLAPLALAVGIASGVTDRRPLSVDFSHLSERVMLYVVFTFGEMIIAISGYFDGGLTPADIYFSAMAFLITGGMLLSYGFVYDRVIDRERSGSGNGYLLLHLFLITALSHVTAGLEFMREPEIPGAPKTLFLTAALLVYLLCLCLLERYAAVRACRNYFLRAAIASAAFILLMVLFRDHPRINVLISAAYIFAIYASLRLYRKRKLEKRRRRPARIRAAEPPVPIPVPVPQPEPESAFPAFPDGAPEWETPRDTSAVPTPESYPEAAEPDTQTEPASEPDAAQTDDAPPEKWETLSWETAESI